MKIVIISHFFPPMNSIASHRPYAWAKYWSQMGHDVTVISTSKKKTPLDLKLSTDGFSVIEIPWLPTWLGETLGDFSERTKPSQFHCGTRIKWARSALAFLINSLRKLVQLRLGLFYAQRMPDVYSFWYWSCRKYLKKSEPWDVTVSTYAPYATHNLGYWMKKSGRTGIWVADYRDLWTDNHIFPGLWPFTLIESLSERRMLKLADAITTVSEPLNHKLKNRYRTSLVRTIENGFEPLDAQSISKEAFFKGDGITRIAHTGAIYPGYRDPSPLFEALRNLKDDSTELKLELVFAGKYSDYIADLAERYGVESHVKQLGMLSHSDSLRMQRDADILLFLEFESKDVSGIISGKIFEYMNSGTEIWAIGITDESIVGNMLNQEGMGSSFGKDSGKIEKALKFLLNDDKKSISKQQNKLPEIYHRKTKAKEFINLILNVAAKKIE